MDEFDKYFKNLDEIEKQWRELKKNNFPLKARDGFWKLCIKGREFFWPMALENKKQAYPAVRTVPAYQRAIMLLEYEKRYKDAMRLCEEANKWKINTDWYDKRIAKLKNLSIANIHSHENSRCLSK